MSSSSRRLGRARITSLPSVEPRSRPATPASPAPAPAAPATPRQKDRYRIVVMGAAGVGKTSIINRFLFSRFEGEYRATVDDLYMEDYIINGAAVTIDFLDTAGAHQFPAMRKLYISTADAFILVYSVDDQESFEEVKRLREEVLLEKGSASSVPLVVVGNKTDVGPARREVAAALAESTVSMDWGHQPGAYVEASAKDNVNVSCIFRELLQQAKLAVTSQYDMVRRRDSAPVLASDRRPPKPDKTHCTIA